MPKSVAGIRVEDRIAQAVKTAVDQGFRAEPHTDGRGLTLYSPDPERAAVRVNTYRCTPARANRFVQDLRKAGVDFDAQPEPSSEPTPTPTPTTVGVFGRVPEGVELPEGALQLSEVLGAAGSDQRVDIAGGIIDSIGEGLGLPRDLANLATLLYLTLNRWSERGGLQSLLSDTSHQLAEAGTAALDLAAEMEARAASLERERDALQAALDRADQKAAAAAHDCGEALERARAAEERAERAESDLTTIRRLLNG